jgi:outer membrane protein OmpA-like peptidoglycan-associated protein
VHFDTNRAVLRGGEFPGAANLVDFLRQHPKRTATIEGFTDSRGGEDANVVLSQRRASAVRDVLVGHGAPAERLSVHGYGEAYPVAGNDTATGRQMNRRVEIVLSHEDGTTAGR